MLQAIVISNQIHGLDEYFQSNDLVQYSIYPVSENFNPELMSYDLLVVPNGSDHVAMLKIRDSVKAFLDAGKALICADGWFTDWIPGNKWFMDNSKKTIDIRYVVKDDPYSFFKNLDIDQFIFSHGMSGYWACGYIEPAKQSHTIVEDTWGRAIIVLDEATTVGTIFLTASGPLADSRYQAAGDAEKNALNELYQRVIRFIDTKKQSVYA